MAASSCVKCGSGSFETKVQEPKGSRYKLTFIQCAGCGGVVGVLDFTNIGAVLEDHGGILKKLEQGLKGLEHGVQQVLRSMKK